MPKLRTYECPGIPKHPGHQFTFLHHPVDEPPPRYCPTCGFDSAGDYEPAVTAPHIQRPIRAIVDNGYRAMEDSSNERAARAQELFGLDKGESDTLKITNLRDNHRVGENSLVPVVNDVSRQMDAVNAFNPNVVGFQPGGSALSPEVQTGPYPNAGARTMQQLRAAHSKYAAATEGRALMSDTPATETQAPGYRRRA